MTITVWLRFQLVAIPAGKLQSKRWRWTIKSLEAPTRLAFPRNKGGAYTHSLKTNQLRLHPLPFKPWRSSRRGPFSPPAITSAQTLLTDDAVNASFDASLNMPGESVRQAFVLGPFLRRSLKPFAFLYHCPRFLSSALSPL